MVYKIDEEYPLEPSKYSSQALYIARQIKANETLVDRVKAAMGKSDAMRVRRLEKTIEDLEAELHRQDRHSLAERRARKAEEKARQAHTALQWIEQLLLPALEKGRDTLLEQIRDVVDAELRPRKGVSPVPRSLPPGTPR